MDEILATFELSPGYSINIGTLSRKSILDCEVEHLGFDGYWVFEATDLTYSNGINIIAKTASYDAGLEMAQILMKLQNSNRLMAA